MRALCERVCIDQRPDIGRKQKRIADFYFLQGAVQLGDKSGGDFLLHKNHAQAGTALPGTGKGRGQRVGNRLLQKRAGIDNHDVLPGGLGNERRQRAGLCREGFGDQPGGLNGAGEGDAGDPFGAGQRGADGSARAGKKMQHIGGNAGLVHQTHGESGDQRRLLGRLGDHRVARSECRQYLAKIAREKFHGLIQAKTPRDARAIVLSSPVGPGKRIDAVKSMRARWA